MTIGELIQNANQETLAREICYRLGIVEDDHLLASKLTDEVKKICEIAANFKSSNGNIAFGYAGLIDSIPTLMVDIIHRETLLEFQPIPEWQNIHPEWDGTWIENDDAAAELARHVPNLYPCPLKLDAQNVSEWLCAEVIENNAIVVALIARWIFISGICLRSGGLCSLPDDLFFDKEDEDSTEVLFNGISYYHAVAEMYQKITEV